MDELHSETARSYNVASYPARLQDDIFDEFRNRPVLQVGDTAPSFRLPTVDGDFCDLSELLDNGHVVLIFGCATAPPSVIGIPELNQLATSAEHADVQFVYVYTREAHPGELLPAHTTMEQKLKHATFLQDTYQPAFTVCADDLEGTVHRAYGTLASMTAIVHRDGVLVHRSAWTQASHIESFLHNLKLRDQYRRERRYGRLALTESLWFCPREDPDDFEQILRETAGEQAVEDNRAHRKPSRVL